MTKRTRSLLKSSTSQRGARAWLAAATIAGVCSIATSATAEPVNAREQQALDVRYLQTELMVAALSCGRPEFHQHYNVFVTRFGNSLKRHGTALQTYFRRQYGAQGTKQMDIYVTRLANEASLRSMQQAAFCTDSVILFDRVTKLEPALLEGFSASVARNAETMAASAPKPKGR